MPTMPEFRHIRSGSLNVAGATGGNSHMAPRSPPSVLSWSHGNVYLLSGSEYQPKSGHPLTCVLSQDTSHVPCKFFRQGACQAGTACPFSHDIGAATEAVCKYFAKGNCKFGPKCANVHLLPDGRRVNYGKNGVTIGASPINLGASRAPPNPPSPSPAPGAGPAAPFRHGSDSALNPSALTSLYRADRPSTLSPDERHQHQSQQQHLLHPHPHLRLRRQPSLDNAALSLDSPYSPSQYGSPRDEDPSRLGFGLSPANTKGLSILDAPLPASFDSNGISNAARFPSAPWPSSVPSKFGLDSPMQSLTNTKDIRSSETLKLLHSSAFGAAEQFMTPGVGSPPTPHSVNNDELFGRRTLHSARFSKPKLMSSSVPKSSSVDRDWESEFAFGEDIDNVPENYVPENLQDLLTPAEKARRGSMRAENDFVEGITKYGSPMGTSPSRWGPLFQRQKEEEEVTRAARSAASAFGHVGSPLRKSTLAQEMGDDFKGSNGTVRLAATRTVSESMSVLSQQLQRSRLDENVGGSSPLLHPTTARISAGGMGAVGKDRVTERHVSGGSVSSSVTGRFTTPIDEEDPAFVFTMEEEDDSTSTKSRKRMPGSPMGMQSFCTFSTPGAAVSGKEGATSTSKESNDEVSVNGR